jgi:hypothetical protein
MQGRLYAVTVHHEHRNFLFLRIVRAPQGDIYVQFPIPGPKECAPHMSFHKDGKMHSKDFDREFMPRRLSKPDKDFHGTENLVNIARESGAWRNIAAPFNPPQFSDFFEIAVEELPGNVHWTQLSLDIVEPGVKPTLIAGAQALRQKFFRHEIPWIAITLLAMPD